MIVWEKTMNFLPVLPKVLYICIKKHTIVHSVKPESKFNSCEHTNRKIHSTALQPLIHLLDEFDVIMFSLQVNLSSNSKKLKENCMEGSPYLFFYIFFYMPCYLHIKGYIPKRKRIYTTL